MPNGRTHRTFNIVLLLLSIGVLWLIVDKFNLFEEPYKSGFVGYLVGVFLLSPDLDLHKNSSKNNWGVFNFIWIPYSMFFKHRGVSHSTLFGSLIRVVYLGFILFVILYVIDKQFTVPFSICPLFLGIWLSDFFHILLDKYA